MVLVPATGVTVKLGPVDTRVPPQDPVNHCHTAPVPKLPPVTVSVFEVTAHVLLLVMLIPVGSVDKLLIVTANVFAALVPQLFPAVTVIFPSCPVVPEVTVIEVVF